MFSSVVTNALLSRHRSAAGTGAVPLRALRVHLTRYVNADSIHVDQWVSYAVQQAAAAGEHGLEVDLRLGHRPICDLVYSLRDDDQQEQGFEFIGGEEEGPEDYDNDGDDLQHDGPDDQHDGDQHDGEEEGPEDYNNDGDDLQHDGPDGQHDGDDDTSSSEEEEANHYGGTPCEEEQPPPPEHTIPSMLFSCAALRSLTLACCRFALPATVSLPSVETLLLSHVNGPDSDVQRLVSSCPRLADLSIVACRALTAVTVLGARLRRLAILCSDSLAAVAVDASELRHFEYSGFVPDGRNFLTLHSDAQRRRGMAYCKVNICGAEATSEYKLTHLRQFLQLFAADAEHLQLESARLGAGADKDASVSFPSFPNLRRLELWGRLPDTDAAAAAAALATVNRILTRTPELESLALGFHPPAYSRSRRESQDCPEELLSGQQLRYNPHGRGLAAAPQAPCLRSTVRELSLVHYQGGVAQRSLARFVLRSAPAIAEVYCGCAEGDWSTLSQLKREIIGWVMNKSANTIFA